MAQSILFGVFVVSLRRILVDNVEYYASLSIDPKVAYCFALLVVKPLRSFSYSGLNVVVFISHVIYDFL